MESCRGRFGLMRRVLRLGFMDLQNELAADGRGCPQIRSKARSYKTNSSPQSRALKLLINAQPDGYFRRNCSGWLRGAIYKTNWQADVHFIFTREAVSAERNFVLGQWTESQNELPRIRHRGLQNEMRRRAIFISRENWIRRGAKF